MDGELDELEDGELDELEDVILRTDELDEDEVLMTMSLMIRRR